MSKHKLISIIAGIAIISGVFIGGNALENRSKAKDNIVTNKVLLANPQSNKGIVVNGGKAPLAIYNNTQSDSSIANYVSNGETVTIEGTENGFYKVKVNQTGDTGYIAESNIQVVTNAVNQNLEKVKLTKVERATLIDIPNFVNIKSEPTSNSQTVGIGESYMSVSILGEQGDWYKINSDGVIGYINKNYVEFSKPVKTYMGESMYGYQITGGRTRMTAIQSAPLDISKFEGTWAPKICEEEYTNGTPNANLVKNGVGKKQLTLTKDLYSYNGVTIKNPKYYEITYNSIALMENAPISGGWNIGETVSIIVALPSNETFNVKNYPISKAVELPMLSEITTSTHPFNIKNHAEAEKERMSVKNTLIAYMTKNGPIYAYEKISQ